MEANIASLFSFIEFTLRIVLPIKIALKKWTKHRDREICYHYNSINQLAKEIYEDGSIVEYEYRTNDGVLTSIGGSSRANTTRISYNQAKNKFIHNDSNGLISTYNYYSLGRKTQIVV